MQRLEYWNLGLQIASENIVLGVGAGDIQDSFNQKYIETGSKLIEEHRDRTHNMYLTMLLGFGIPGILLLLISHIHYLRDQFRNGQLVGLGFIIIIMISYLVEDTLETQSGITFFRFVLWAFHYPHQKTKEFLTFLPSVRKGKCNFEVYRTECFHVKLS